MKNSNSTAAVAVNIKRFENAFEDLIFLSLDPIGDQDERTSDVGSGFTVRQAEAQTKLLNEVFMNELATKDEISMSFKEMDNRFKEVQNQFKVIDNRFKEIDNRFDALNNCFQDIDNRFKEVRLKIDNGFARIDLQMKDLPNAILARLTGSVYFYSFFCTWRNCIWFGI